MVSVVRPPDEAYLRSKGVRAAYFIVDVTRDRLDRISAMVERGALNLPVGEILDLADASTAHRMLDGAPHKPEKSCSGSQTDISASTALPRRGFASASTRSTEAT
jgi:hypothetical protein